MSYQQLSTGKEGDNNTENYECSNAKLHGSTVMKDDRQFVFERGCIPSGK
jgi:hypothetical protein